MFKYNQLVYVLEVLSEHGVAPSQVGRVVEAHEDVCYVSILDPEKFMVDELVFTGAVIEVPVKRLVPIIENKNT